MESQVENNSKFNKNDLQVPRSARERMKGLPQGKEFKYWSHRSGKSNDDSFNSQVNSNSTKAGKKTLKDHGCESPFNFMQYTSWFALVFFLLAYFLLVFPAFSLSPSLKVCLNPSSTLFLQVIYTTIILLCYLSLIISGAKCTLSIPTDPIVLAERQALKNG